MSGGQSTLISKHIVYKYTSMSESCFYSKSKGELKLIKLFLDERDFSDFFKSPQLLLCFAQ